MPTTEDPFPKLLDFDKILESVDRRDLTTRCIDHMRILPFVFGLARLILGLFGAVSFLSGLVGVFIVRFDGAPWSVVFYSALSALFGFCIAYGAFVRFPWEHRLPELAPRPDDIAPR